MFLKTTEDEELVTKNAQPALVALEWSLATMWQSNDVIPSIVLGHSVGEIAAACVAGAMTMCNCFFTTCVHNILI